jgi:hypothetical protein
MTEAQKQYDVALAEARELREAAAEAHANVDRPRRELLSRLRSRREISYKIEDLRDAREAAGARFAAAVDELHLAFVDLAALDHVLANRGVNVDAEHLATHSALGEPPDLWSLAHPKYAPFKPANWNTEIHALRDRYLAAATAEPEAPPPLVVHERN